MYSAVLSRLTPEGWNPILYGVPLVRREAVLAALGAGDVDKPAAAASTTALELLLRTWLPARLCATPTMLLRRSSVFDWGRENVADVGDGDNGASRTMSGAGGADSRPRRRRLAGGAGRRMPLVAVALATRGRLWLELGFPGAGIWLWLWLWDWDWAGVIESRRTRAANGRSAGGGDEAANDPLRECDWGKARWA